MNIKNNLINLFSRLTNRFNKRDELLWAFGEWFGCRICDNSYYFAEYVAKNHPDIKIVWIKKKGTDISCLNKKIVSLVMDSAEAVNVLKHAGYVFVNQGIGDLTQKGRWYISGAVIINLWHGQPWKKIGSEMYDNKIVRLYSKLMINLLVIKPTITLSPTYTRIMSSAYCCNSKSLIPVGYPRNSLFYDKERVELCRLSLCNKINMQYNTEMPKDVKIIAYLPTFREDSSQPFSFVSLNGNESFRELLEKNNAIVVQKMHFAASQNNKIDSSKEDRVFNLGDYNTQELLAASDILVTDYSSCFFDYLLLNRPIVHYIYDYKSYSEFGRGLYFDIKDVVCGDTPMNENDLIISLGNNLSDPQKDMNLRSERKHKFLTYEDKNSCEKLYNIITTNSHPS